MYQDISGFNIETDVKTRVSQAHAHMWKHAEPHNWIYVYTHRYKETKVFSYNGKKEVPGKVSPGKIKIIS